MTALRRQAIMQPKRPPQAENPSSGILTQGIYTHNMGIDVPII
ncbi:hypothetical protein CLOSYM_03987 [[Clostridium] symbiosum ATCC 14940]|uniref:Uncharacterized protein n=1 Tax=[Clostridium] symbiosum ATCC 14940 TaxID=411472 RepID=A0ABC9TT63_CLOSY|nr:hypothetical protein CLOSYM_03987 [[Clostridium] symbiosum ATCC 14940]